MITYSTITAGLLLMTAFMAPVVTVARVTGQSWGQIAAFGAILTILYTVVGFAVYVLVQGGFP